MSDEFAPPVKGIIKALDAGIKLTKRVSRSASEGPAELAHISELAQNLQTKLEKSCQAISDAYRDAFVSCGEPFAKALIEDESVQHRLKEVRIDLIDQIDECQDYDEKLDSFQPSAFTNVQQQSKRCCTECTFIFNNLRDRILQTDRLHFRTQDKSPPLSPAAPVVLLDLARRRPLPIADSIPSAMSPRLPHQDSRDNKTPVPENSESGNLWSLSGPYFDHSTKNAPGLGGSAENHNHRTREISPPPRYSFRDHSPERLTLIPKDVVNSRINANDEFLERRRQSRIMFHNEIRHSFSSIEENRASESFSDGSPWSSYSSTSSPIERHSSRGSGYGDLVGRKRSQGQTSQGGSSRNGSLRDAKTETTNEYFSPASIKPPMSPGISEYQPSDGGTSLWMKSPVSPPTTDVISQDNNAQWGKLGPPTSLAATLQVPGFAAGVEDGLEVVSAPIESGLEVVPQSSNPAPLSVPGRSPSQVGNHLAGSSMKSIESPLRNDCSFYKLDGFCPGAKSMLRGETGFRVVKRPSGHYSATLSARCIKCSYEVGWNDVEKDRLLDRSGIYSNTGIRWRQRFISKCHLKTSSVDDPIYGCIFCIESHHTVEDHDATVFFSITSLFRHLARHPRPLPPIAGITTVYGIQPPSVLDFDIQFTIHEPKLSTYCMSEILPKVLLRPSAIASSTHHPKPTAKTFRDPDSQPSMHFAEGAKILGVAFPERWGGLWCTGYHDGERGSFPASVVSLLGPRKEDLRMEPKSKVVVVAKWEWKPSKSEKEAGWLRFKEGERIRCVGFRDKDFWCWSGCNMKGKWGVFPKAFVEVVEGVSLLSSMSNSNSNSSANTNIRSATAPATIANPSPPLLSSTASTSTSIIKDPNPSPPLPRGRDPVITSSSFPTSTFSTSLPASSTPITSRFNLGSRMPSFPLNRNRSARVGSPVPGQSSVSGTGTWSGSGSGSGFMDSGGGGGGGKSTGSTIAGLVLGHRRAASVRSNTSAGSSSGGVSASGRDSPVVERPWGFVVDAMRPGSADRSEREKSGPGREGSSWFRS